MTMNPYWLASEANSVPEKKAGPDWVHWCMATRIGALAFALSGTYTYICKPPGLLPKFVIWTSEAADARGAICSPPPAASAAAAITNSARIRSFMALLSLPPKYFVVSCELFQPVNPRRSLLAAPSPRCQRPLSAPALISEIPDQAREDDGDWG